MPKPKPLPIVIGSLLAYTYAVVLLAVSLSLLYELLSHHGHIGTENLNSAGRLGVKVVSALFIIGALLLASGAYLLISKKSRSLLLTPLIILLVVGTIGQIADIVGTASVSSDVTDFGILILAALPVVLVTLPASRKWLNAK